MIERYFLDAARRVYTRKYAAWQGEKDGLDRLVADAIAAKQPIMSGDYWQAEWRAREELRAAERVLEILTI